MIYWYIVNHYGVIFEMKKYIKNNHVNLKKHTENEHSTRAAYYNKS